ncbi:MAG: glycoside hydrolase family 28 protein [Pedobacter sp.]|nr:MAG: glycoside hydrolase family 28 protein [Pedobacter sp.]
MKKLALLLSFFAISFAGNSQKNNPTYSFENLPVIATTSFKTDTFNVLRYGAKADGITLDTKAINDAIKAAHQNGGGVVFVPKGLYITGPIEIKSNVNLHLAKNAILQYTRDFSQYDLVRSNWEGLPQMRNQSPIWATNQENIAITGHGIIDGGGDAWRFVKKDKQTASQWNKLVASGGVVSEDKKVWYPTVQSYEASKAKNPGELKADRDMNYYMGIKDFLRPNLMVLTSCKRILIEGVTFQNSAAWNLHPLMSEDIIIRNIQVKNPWYAQNGDGLDLESCKNVLVEDSIFDVGDDGICIKSGRDAWGRERAMPTENVIIRNCTIYQAHGGFVIGSEMSGGAKNIFVSDCTFIGTDIGLRFKTTRGRGGVVENIHIKNINMTGILGEAILFDMYYAAIDPVPLTGEQREAPAVVLLPVTEETPSFKNFTISNVVCDGAEKALFVRGLPELQIQNIQFDNMFLKANKGIDLQEATGIRLKDVHLQIKDGSPLISIQNGRQIEFENLDYNSSPLLFKITGAQSSQIKAKGVRLDQVKQTAQFGAGAQEKVLTINK